MIIPGFFSGIIFIKVIYVNSCLTNPQPFLLQKRSLGDLLRCFLTTEKGMAIYQLVLFYFFIFFTQAFRFLVLACDLGMADTLHKCDTNTLRSCYQIRGT